VFLYSSICFYTAAYVFIQQHMFFLLPPYCTRSLERILNDLPLNSFIQEELFPLAKTAATLQKNLAKEGRLPNFPTSVFAKVRRGEPGILKGCGRSARC
jgi:hypothetical protein